jgi:hypothetical protein
MINVDVLFMNRENELTIFKTNDNEYAIYVNI